GLRCACAITGRLNGALRPFAPCPQRHPQHPVIFQLKFTRDAVKVRTKKSRRGSFVWLDRFHFDLLLVIGARRHRRVRWTLWVLAISGHPFGRQKFLLRVTRTSTRSIGRARREPCLDVGPTVADPAPGEFHEAWASATRAQSLQAR